MYKMARILFVLVLLTSFSLVTAHPTFACSCMVPPAPAQALEEAQAVFVGRATQVPSGDMVNSADPVMVTFEVSQVWKGPMEPVMTIRTAASSASCGYTFEEGKEYIVYAWGADDGWLDTNLCSRTAPLDAAAEDIAALGAGQTPAAAPAEPTTESEEEAEGISLGLWGAGAGLVAAGILAAVILARRGALPGA